QLLDMMGEGGRRDLLNALQIAAAGLAFASTDLPEDFHPAGFGQCLGDQFHLAGGEFGRHGAKMAPCFEGYKWFIPAWDCGARAKARNAGGHVGVQPRVLLTAPCRIRKAVCGHPPWGPICNCGQDTPENLGSPWCLMNQESPWNR